MSLMLQTQDCQGDAMRLFSVLGLADSDISTKWLYFLLWQTGAHCETCSPLSFSYTTCPSVVFHFRRAKLSDDDYIIVYELHLWLWKVSIKFTDSRWASLSFSTQEFPSLVLPLPTSFFILFSYWFCFSFFISPRIGALANMREERTSSLTTFSC